MAQYQVYFDTLEGERKYNVDIGDDERLEDVLGEVIADLTEKGHMMRGLSTGDLKVVWGGRGGRELDLSGTLPEQGVRPNDVLRVLVEVYEGGGRSLRTDRITKEWDLLSRLVQYNPTRIQVLGRIVSSPDEEIFRVRLHESPGIVSAHDDQVSIRTTHTLRLSFTRFFPEVPIECYAEEPLFHPNIKPESGFVCLWEQANPRDTVIQALARAQAMAAFRMVNLGSNHLMNRSAAEWYSAWGHPQALVPLTWEELRVYEMNNGRMVWLEPGRQLSGSTRSRMH